ncbi:hypothetical protein QCA50_015409 [Cerrena zonata]|uniref:AB hydrolase-1 domain-containing protein n=1 Tax=Cerrena zonata TaxID=2478898 RepID=A0AAW0FJR4_9APHY
MPFAPVDNNGAVLFYEDSGAPDATEEYTTLVLFHGIMYTNGIFAKLLPFAARHHVRLIRVNQRDYPPSSLFTPLELEEFNSTDKNAQARCLANRGTEVANLLVHLIDTLKLPPISANNDAKAVGGISVLGWSMGTHLPFALLSNASALLPQIQQQLQHYLRSAV